MRFCIICIAYNSVEKWYDKQVRTSKELGRYLAAKRDILAGEVLYKEAPTVVGPKLVEPSPVCLGCLKSPGTACCEGCGWPVCSPACPGLRDPHCHAVECKILSLAPVSHSQQCRYVQLISCLYYVRYTFGYLFKS